MQNNPRKVFINYRINDSQHAVDRIFDILVKLGVPTANIFRDTSGIEKGAEFSPVILKALNEADVVLAVIGDRWCDEEYKKRLHAPEDWVCKEIAIALADPTQTLVPILISNFTPVKNELPESIQGLCDLNYAEAPREFFEIAIATIAEQQKLFTIAYDLQLLNKVKDVIEELFDEYDDLKTFLFEKEFEQRPGKALKLANIASPHKKMNFVAMEMTKWLKNNGKLYRFIEGLKQDYPENEDVKKL